MNKPNNNLTNQSALAGSTTTTNERFYWLNENSRKFLDAGYLSDAKTAEERIREIADRAQDILGIDGYADKFFDYMSRGFYSLASPVWSNFGKQRGLPISCFGSHVDDDIGNILYSQSEVGMMSKLGGAHMFSMFSMVLHNTCSRCSQCSQCSMFSEYTPFESTSFNARMAKQQSSNSNKCTRNRKL